MKRTIIILGSMLLFCSCSTTYYYSTLNSENKHVFKTEQGDFVTENDSLYIIYSFFGENAPINIGVYNKLSNPIFVDWSQSALIIDDIAEPHSEEQIIVSGTTKSTSYSTKVYDYGLTISRSESVGSLMEG